MNTKLTILQKILQDIYLANGITEDQYLMGKDSAFVMRDQTVHLVTVGTRLEHGALTIGETRPAVEADVTPQSFNQYGEDCKSMLLNVWLSSTKNDLFQAFCSTTTTPQIIPIAMPQPKVENSDETDTSTES